MFTNTQDPRSKPCFISPNRNKLCSHVPYAVLGMHLWSSSFPFYSDCSMCLQKEAPFSRAACFSLFLIIVRSSAWPPPSSAAVRSLREHGLYLEAYSTLNRKIKSEPGPPARALHLDPVAASDRPSTGCLDSFSSEVPHRIRAISPLGT